MRLLIFITLALSVGCVGEPELGDPQVEGVCVSDALLVFDGGGSGNARSSLDLGRLNLDLGLAAGSRVTLRSAVLSAGEGITDFRFAERMRVELMPGNQPAVALAEVFVSSNAISVNLGGNPDLDLAGYLGTDPEVAVDIAGDVPEQRWSVVMDLCFDLESP